MNNGEEEYPSLRDQYIRAGDAFVLVYDITSRKSFDELDSIIQNMTDVIDGRPAALVLCGNKTDLASKRVVSTEEGKELAKSLDCPFVEPSAKTT